MRKVVCCVALLMLAAGCNDEGEASTESEEEPTTEETFTEAAKMSANPTEIAGVVVDAEGNPVEEARVYFVEGPVPLPDIAALTDSSGRFALSAPVSGTYQLGVSSEGSASSVQQKTVKVEVGGERGSDLEIQLYT
jgi:hypothetical protein